MNDEQTKRLKGYIEEAREPCTEADGYMNDNNHGEALNSVEDARWALKKCVVALEEALDD